MTSISAISLRLQLARGCEPLDAKRLDHAALAVARMRDRWGWRFGKGRVKVMAIDLLLAEAAIRAYSPTGKEERA